MRGSIPMRAGGWTIRTEYKNHGFIARMIRECGDCIEGSVEAMGMWLFYMWECGNPLEMFADGEWSLVDRAMLEMYRVKNRAE